MTEWKFPVIAAALLVAASSVHAGTYYISPTGSDSNSGTDTAHPWLTFAHAKTFLVPGTTLDLLNGTYNGSISGFINVDCSAGWSNGTASQPITIQSVNERQAYLPNDGTGDSVSIAHCTYWIVIGLHASSADNSSVCYNGSGSNCGGAGYAFIFISDSHLTVRRNIADHNNRFTNSHLISLQYGTTSSLVEENEGYYFSRHCLDDYRNGVNARGATSNEYRRNYCNSRGWDIGQPTGAWPNAVGSGHTVYGSGGDYIENEIMENMSGTGEDLRCAYVTTSNPGCPNNLYQGNISLHAATGFLPFSSGSTGATGDMPANETYSNNVSVNDTSEGVYARGTKSSTVFSHHSSFGGNLYGFVTDGNGSLGNDGNYGMTVQNCVAINSGGTGFYFSGVPSWSIMYGDAYGNATNFNPAPPNANITCPAGGCTQNPNFGSCYLWVPASSPLHGAASDGGDIGANVLYAYEGGLLTTKKLWNNDGSFAFSGSTVVGLNDIAGSSLFDIGKRFNINQNGCPFPSGYGSTPAPPARPQGAKFQ